MIELKNLEFEYMDKERNEREVVDFVGLADLFDNLLEYDLETETMVLNIEDIDSYALEVTEETTFKDVQDFFSEALEEEGISDIIQIKVMDRYSGKH